MRVVRPIRVEGDLAYITLTKGYVAVIDATDVPLVERWNWYAIVRPRAVYAARRDRRRIILLHRAILGEPSGLEVDHIDTDGINNRRINLRQATHTENAWNSRLPVTNTSGLKGITWHPRNAKWHARIKIDGKQHWLGMFASPVEAHAAYCAASARMRGEFGRVA
jgi:hypothetical protein